MTSLWKKSLKRVQMEDEEYKYNRKAYDDTFNIPKSIMKIITIRITHKLPPSVSKCWEMFYWFEFCNMCVAIVLEFISMCQTARRGSFEDAIKIFRMLPCFGMVLLGIAKSFMMVYHRPVFENLVNEVGDMWPKGRVKKAEQIIIDSSQKQLMFVMTGYHWCNQALLLSFLTPPLFESFKRALGYESEMLLHFFYWLPFDPYQPGYIDILLVVQTWHALVVIWSNQCGDMLFFAFLSHLTTQFDLLSWRIQNLIKVPIDKQLIDEYPLSECIKLSTRDEAKLGDFVNVDVDKEQDEELSKIILRHRALIRLCGDVEKMFTFALLINFVNSSIIICFSGFCCVLVEKWNEIAYKSFLVTALSQTFLICWYGQKLLDSSNGVANALYNCGWYVASRKIRSSIIIMLHRAQKEVRVTTCGFSVVSLKSYTRIIKTAWSYFTLLLNVYRQ